MGNSATKREHIAARWVIEQAGDSFSDEQREKLARWLAASKENCAEYLRLVRAWYWTLSIFRGRTLRKRSKGKPRAGLSAKKKS